MSKKTDIFFSFLDYYETNVNSKNDMRICKTILDNSSQLESIDIKTLAAMSDTSTASVSRFVKRFPIKNYKEFIHDYLVDFSKLQGAKSAHLQALEQFGEQGILKEEQRIALENLNGTQKVLDANHVDRLCNMLLKAKSVTFVGANHSLEIVSDLHVLLNGLGIPAYIYKQVDRMGNHLSLLGKGDMVVFISIHGRYQATTGDSLLKKLDRSKIHTALITQTKRIDPNNFDEVIYFGIDQSWNYGYYSLPVTVKCISKVLISKI